MFSSPLYSMFSSIGLFYGVIVPLLITLIYAFLIGVSLQHTGARARGAAQSIYCLTFMAVGILLMTIAAIPTATSLLAGFSYSPVTYVGLIILFAAGGWLFLTHEQWLVKVDIDSKMIPVLLFLYLFKSIGMLATFFAGLSILLNLVLGESSEVGWWVLPITVFVYGLIISWISWSASPESNVFHDLPLFGSPKKKEPSFRKKTVKKVVKKATRKKVGKKK